jgi:hypothetical protein
VYNKYDKINEKMEYLSKLKTLYEDFVKLKLYFQEEMLKVHVSINNLQSNLHNSHQQHIFTYLDIPILSPVWFSGSTQEV